jgi:hypothetical protein
MLVALKKMFGSSFMNSGSDKAAMAAAKGKADARAAVAQALVKMPIEQIKLRMELLLHDMKGIAVERLQYKIRSSSTVEVLWMLRSDMYQTISMQHGQSEAALRINGLLPCFNQWIAPRQMVKI